jgi:hypothetical protein
MTNGAAVGCAVKRHWMCWESVDSARTLAFGSVRLHDVRHNFAALASQPINPLNLNSCDRPYNRVWRGSRFASQT